MTDENDEDEGFSMTRKNKWGEFLAGVIYAILITLGYAFLSGNLVFIMRFVSRNLSGEGECFGTLFPDDKSKPPYCYKKSETQPKQGGGETKDAVKKKMKNLLNEVTFGVNECSWPYNTEGWFWSSIANIMRDVYSDGRGILNRLMKWLNTFNVNLTIIIAPLMFVLLIIVFPICGGGYTFFKGFISGSNFNDLPDLLKWFQWFGKTTWGVLWFFFLMFPTSILTNLVIFVQTFVTFTLLPLALNYGSVFAIISRNYFTFAMIFAAIVIYYAFLYLNGYSAVTMLLTMLVFLFMEIKKNVMNEIEKSGATSKPCYGRKK